MRRNRLIRRSSVIFVMLCLTGLILGCRTKTVPKGQTDHSPTPTTIPSAEVNPSATPTPHEEQKSTPTLNPEPTPTPTLDLVEPSPTVEKMVAEPNSIGPFVPAAQPENFDIGSIVQLLTSPGGNLWVIGKENVVSYDGEKWLSHGEISGHSLGFDGVERLWIVDKQGEWISAYDGAAWEKYGSEQGWSPAGKMFNMGLYSSVSDGVVTDAGGNTWLTTVNDIRVLSGGEWFIYSPEDAGFTPSELMTQEGFGFLLSDIAIDTAGDVWVTDCAWMGPGPQGQGARWFDGQHWSGYDSPVVAAGCIKDVEVGDDGRIWAGVDDEVWRFTSGEGWKILHHPVQFPIEGVRWGWIVDLLLDGTDAVWMTMVPCGGASCDLDMTISFWIHEDEWLVIGENGIPDVARGANDLSWGCYANGLYAVVSGEFIPVNDDLPGSCQVQADKTGRVWLAIDGESTLWVFDAPQ